MGGATQEIDLGLVTMSAMTAAWTVVYVLSRVLFPARSKDFCNRIVSLIHVFVSCYFCSKSVADWSRPLDGVGASSTYPQVRFRAPGNALGLSEVLLYIDDQNARV